MNYWSGLPNSGKVIMRWRGGAPAGVVAMTAAFLVVGACGEAPPRVVTVLARDFRFTPATLELTRQQPVRLNLRNPDVVEHDYQVEELRVREGTSGHSHGPGEGHRSDTLHLHAVAGGDDTLVFTPLTRGTFTVFCTVLGHKEAGMIATVTVR